MNDLPWFRFYHEFAVDPVMRLLAFEDQRHFVIVLCMKARGDLDKLYTSDAMRDKVICAQLGLTPIFADEAKRRLQDAGLIADDWQPLGWEKRQMRSDSSAERQRRYRDRHAQTSPSRHGDGLEEEREKEEIQIPPAPTEPPPQPPAGLNPEAWERWVQYRKASRKPIKPASVLAAQRKLAGYGDHQAAVVEHSIANGYQGLWEPRDTAHRRNAPTRNQSSQDAVNAWLSQGGSPRADV